MKDSKSVMLHFRVTGAEAKMVKAAAEKHGFSLSDWLRKCLMTPQKIVLLPPESQEDGYVQPEAQSAADPEMIKAQTKRAAVSATIAKGAKESFSAEIVSEPPAPAKTDIEKRALQIYNEGLPMRVARQQAKKELGL